MLFPFSTFEIDPKSIEISSSWDSSPLSTIYLLKDFSPTLRQTLLAWPFLWHIKHSQAFAGHFSGLCFLPHLKHGFNSLFDWPFADCDCCFPSVWTGPLVFCCFLWPILLLCAVSSTIALIYPSARSMATAVLNAFSYFRLLSDNNLHLMASDRKP